jgi:ATP-dependent RNA helicase RhlE
VQAPEPARAEPVRAEPVRAEPAPRAAEAPRERGRRERAPGKDDAVVGMGDHLPDFIALSFDKRRT